MALKFITAEEAASFVHHDDNVGFSGFTPAGCPKVVPGAIAKKAIAEHEKGNPFQIGMFTGASTGDKLDGELARANAIKFRTPYQSNKDLRALLNSHGAQYFDMHLSELAQSLRYGFLGKIDVAIVEAADVTEDGEIVPTSGVGILPTICRMADRIIIELNCRHPKEIRGMHDIYEPADPPYRREIPIYTPSDRIGSDCVKVDPAKIVGVVKTDEPNEGGKFSPLDDVTMAIGQNVANFLVGEIKAGRLPKEFVPLQSGVGNVANAVLGCMGENKDIPAFNVYTEVIQDAVIALMKEGRVKFASGCSLSVSNEVIRDIYANLDFFKDKILLRPQEISNNPEVARRLGLVAINTALEADIFGNINSTHVSGTRMMNGIGGSGAALAVPATSPVRPCCPSSRLRLRRRKARSAHSYRWFPTWITANTPSKSSSRNMALPTCAANLRSSVHVASSTTASIPTTNRYWKNTWQWVSRDTRHRT